MAFTVLSHPVQVITRRQVKLSPEKNISICSNASLYTYLLLYLQSHSLISILTPSSPFIWPSKNTLFHFVRPWWCSSAVKAQIFGFNVSQGLRSHKYFFFYISFKPKYQAGLCCLKRTAGTIQYANHYSKDIKSCMRNFPCALMNWMLIYSVDSTIQPLITTTLLGFQNNAWMWNCIICINFITERCMVIS